MDFSSFTGSARSSASPSPGAAAGKNTSMGGSDVGPATASAGMFTPDVGDAGDLASSGVTSDGLFGAVGRSPYASDFSEAVKAFGSGKVRMGAIPEGDDDVNRSGGSDRGRSSNHVGISRFSCEDLLTNRCCGAVGAPSNLKMCIAVNDQCAVERHKTVKQDVSHLSGNGDIYVINGSRTPGTTVQLEPHLLSDAITDEANHALTALYISKTRLPGDWAKIFGTLSKLGPRDDVETAVEKLEDMEDVIKLSKLPDAAFTPLKHSRKVADITSPVLEEGYDVPFYALTMEYPEGTSPSFQVMQREWPGLIKNFSSLRSLTEASQLTMSTFKRVVSDGFKDVDVFRSDYLKEVGKPPPSWGTASLFSVVESVARRQEKAAEVMTELHEAISLEEGGRMVPGGVVTNAFAQIQRIFCHQRAQSAQTTTDLATAVAKIDDMQKQIDQLIANGTVQTGAPSNPGLFGSHAGGSNFAGSFASVPAAPQTWQVYDQAIKDLSQEVSGFDQRQASLETRVNILEVTWAQSGNSLECGSLRFDTLSDVEAFVIKNGITEKDLCFFPDLHALLNMAAQGGITSSKESFNMRASSQKSGFVSIQSGYVITSFDFEVPVMYGETSGNNDTFIKNRQVLPAAKSYDQWDNPKDRKGVSHILEAAVKQEEKSLRKGAATNLRPDALNISTQFINEATASSRSLSAYVSKTMTDLTAKGMGKTQAWDLVSMQVRGFFEEVHMERQVGKSDYTTYASLPATVLWGCIKGLLKVREFTEKAYGGHATMSSVINTFLRDNSVFKEDLDALTKRIENAEKLAKGAKSAADKSNGKG